MSLVKTGPNLDAIFNHQLTNVTGEPLTPTKISIFYLVRTLFHAHFGVGAVPSLKPFNKAEKTKFVLNSYSSKKSRFQSVLDTLRIDFERF